MPGMSDETAPSNSSSPFTPPSAPAGTPTKDDCNMALLMYILAIITGWIGPLIIWLIKKDSSQFVNDQGKEVLNFQITVFIAGIVCGLLTMVIIGCFLLPIVVICSLVFTIMGAVAVSKGKAYRFPVSLRLIK